MFLPGGVPRAASPARCITHHYASLATATHTLQQKLRHQVPKSWKKMFHFISYAANPINQTEGQQFKPKLVTKQTPSTEPKVNSFNFQLKQVRLHRKHTVSSLATDCILPQWPPAHPTKQTPSTNQKSTVQTTPTTYRNKPHQQTRKQQFSQILGPTKQTPSTNQKSTVQTKPKDTGFTSFEKVHTNTPSQEGWVFKKQTPLTDQKSTVQPERKPTKQTPSTDQKSTVPPKPRTYKANPINKTEDNSSNRSYDLQKQTPSTNQKATVQPDPRTYKTNPINKPEINSSTRVLS